ncbi:MAG: ornithine carbamoyltransferase, partial [Candidatus Omnitrophota bacterium]
ESVKDFGEVLSRYLDGLVMRTFSHQQIIDFAACSRLPIINGLTDLLHPCQVLSDLFTIKEKKGGLSGIKLAYVGDGNNVAHSLLFGCAKLGLQLTIATPKKYEPNQEIFAQAEKIAAESAAVLILSNDPFSAVKDADIIYTDVWTSMGKEAEYKKRKNAFQAFQLNSKLVSAAKADYCIMHCLPAHRGEEITDEVIDGPHSIVFDQAENRMHLQKALLLILLKGKY